jgi:hypothetical protein
MDVDQAQEEEDRFLAFEDYARSALSLEPEEDQDQAPNGTDPRPVGLGGAGSHLGSSRLALLIPAVLPPQFYSLISLRLHPIFENEFKFVCALFGC